MKRTFLLLSFLACVLLALATGQRLDLYSGPFLVPPYPEMGFVSRLEGDVEVLIRFEDSKPVPAEIAKSELKFVRSDRQVLPEPDDIVVRTVQNTLLTTVRQWRYSSGTMKPSSRFTIAPTPAWGEMIGHSLCGMAASVWPRKSL